MSDYSVKSSASLTLTGTESLCETEQTSGCRLDMIKFGTLIGDDGTVFRINNSEYFFESSFKILNDLHLVEVANGDSKAITEEKKKAGWIPICDSEIYVEDSLKRVLVFGKKS